MHYSTRLLPSSAYLDLNLSHAFFKALHFPYRYLFHVVSYFNSLDYFGYFLYLCSRLTFYYFYVVFIYFLSIGVRHENAGNTLRDMA